MLNIQEIADQLAVNAEAIRALVQAIPDAQARWQPDPETWSIAQVMEHLYNEERIDFRQHLQEMLNDPPQPWGAFQDAYVPVKSCRQALEAFLSEREASIAWLEALPSPSHVCRQDDHPQRRRCPRLVGRSRLGAPAADRQDAARLPRRRDRPLLDHVRGRELVRLSRTATQKGVHSSC
jgi:hypothetical protein